MGQRLIVGVVVIAACLATAGCAVTRKSVSMDSGSRMPWLGMELAPKRRTPAPETTRIRRDSTAPVRAVPAKLVKEPPAQKPVESKSEETWWQKITGTEKKAPIQLPRTDLADQPVQANAALKKSVDSIAQSESDVIEF